MKKTIEELKEMWNNGLHKEVIPFMDTLEENEKSEFITSIKNHSKQLDIDISNMIKEKYNVSTDEEVEEIKNLNELKFKEIYEKYVL